MSAIRPVGASGRLQLAHIGGETNYLEIEADGTIHMVGDATGYLDELGDITRIKVKSANNRITVDDAESRMAFGTSCDKDDDYLYCNIQLNHDWENASAIYPHLHWEQTSASTPNWLLLYRWQVQGQLKTTAWTPLKWSSNAFTYTSGTLNQISAFSSITPGSYGEVSDILQFRITRDCANESNLFLGSDAGLGTQYATSFDIHKRVDTIGSRTEYSKD